MEQAEAKPQVSRIQSIDGFRGMAVLLMVLGNFALTVNWVPAFLKHQPDIGLTVADLVAPMFIFAIAMTIGPSMRKKRDAFGAESARARMVLRYLAIIGIGAIITGGEVIVNPTGRPLAWGVLQCIGTSGLLLLIVVFSPAWLRLLSGLFLLAVHQFLLDRYILDIVLNSTHNGLFGTLSWAGMLMIASTFADGFYKMESFHRKTAWLAILGSLSAGIGLLLSIWLPISKARASVSYMAVSLGFCLLVFALFHTIFDSKPGRLKWLQRFGRNPLGLYLVHILLLAVMILPGGDSWHAGAPIWLSLLQAAFILGMLLWLAYFMEKKGWILKL
jgi:predicted acyltransferase